MEEIEEIKKYMIVQLIRNKMLDNYRIRDRYFHVVTDETGLATSSKIYSFLLYKNLIALHNCGIILKVLYSNVT